MVAQRFEEGGHLAMIRFVRLLAVASILATPLGSVQAQSTYTGMVPLAGDDHQHAGDLLSNYQLNELIEGRRSICPHDWGVPTTIYDLHRDRGYDWALLSYHDFGLTGSPTGSSAEEWAWWIDPASQPISLPDGTPVIVPDPNGLPDYLNGGAVSPPWNEALSLSTAAELKNDPANGFLAIAGREYTATPGQGGHKVVALPGVTDRICQEPATWYDQGRRARVHPVAAVSLGTGQRRRAHPGAPGPG